MVSFNHWLSSIKTNTLSRYQTLVNANHASSNWVQIVGVGSTNERINKFQLHVPTLCDWFSSSAPFAWCIFP